MAHLLDFGHLKAVKMSGQAGFIAKQGFSMLYNATVTSVGAISSGINKAVKSYSDYYERDQLESLRKSGKTPAENLASGELDCESQLKRNMLCCILSLLLRASGQVT